MIYLFSVWVRKRDIIRNDKGFRVQDICLCFVSLLSFAILSIILVQYTNGSISAGVSAFIMIAMIVIVMTFYLSYEPKSRVISTQNVIRDPRPVCRGKDRRAVLSP